MSKKKTKLRLTKAEKQLIKVELFERWVKRGDDGRLTEQAQQIAAALSFIRDIKVVKVEN